MLDGPLAEILARTRTHTRTRTRISLLSDQWQVPPNRLVEYEYEYEYEYERGLIWIQQIAHSIKCRIQDNSRAKVSGWSQDKNPENKPISWFYKGKSHFVDFLSWDHTGKEHPAISTLPFAWWAGGFVCFALFDGPLERIFTISRPHADQEIWY